MKNMKNKFWNLLAENIVLLALIAGVGIGAFPLLWHCSVTGCLKTTTSVDYASWVYWKDVNHVGNQMIVKDQEAYLLDECTGEILAGPYAWIIVDDFAFPCHIARYITEDNLIGFIDDRGNEITPAVYTDAECFSEGRALVTNQKENQYEIDTDGLKIP